MLTEIWSPRAGIFLIFIEEKISINIFFSLQSRSFNKHHDISFTNIVIVVSIISVEIIRKGSGDCYCIE